jgi:hypothetical protein
MSRFTKHQTRHESEHTVTKTYDTLPFLSNNGNGGTAGSSQLMIGVVISFFFFS